MELSVIVPCFNEEANVRRFPKDLLGELQKLALDYEVVAVNDGSTDGTCAALEELNRTYPRFLYLEHPVNMGLGAALRTALQTAKGKWVATLDADLTFHPGQIGALLARQRETDADCVAGSPFLGRTEGVSWARTVPSRLINLGYRLAVSWRITAYTPLFRLYRRAALKSLEISSRGFEANAEILWGLLSAGYRVEEAPVVLTCRTLGRSKLQRLRELKRHLKLLARILTT